MDDRQKPRQNRQGAQVNKQDDTDPMEGLIVQRAELQICATILWHKGCAQLAVQVLKPEDFCDKQARAFFRLYQHRAEKTGCTFVDVRDFPPQMEKSRAWSSVGEATRWINGLASGELANPMASYMEYNVHVVKSAAAKRKAHETVTKVAQDLAQDNLTAEAVAGARDALTEALAMRTSRRRVSETVLDLLDEMSAGTHRNRALATGIGALDELIGGGFLPGQFCVVAARPGGGKSSFAMQVAINAARRGKRVLFHSLEMSETELTLRWICNQSGVSFTKAQEGRLDLLERQRFADAANEVGNLPIALDDTPNRRVFDIESAARDFKKEGGLDLLVVDYLTLITPTESRYANRREQVDEIARDLKLMARSLQVPVLVPAQLKRSETNARPQLKDLRESGAIEQDADVVLFLSGADAGRFDSHSVTLKIGKQRNGPLCEVDVRWTGPFMRFDDIPPSDEVF